jgi:hypothetical protein
MTISKEAVYRPGSTQQKLTPSGRGKDGKSPPESTHLSGLVKCGESKSTPYNVLSSMAQGGQSDELSPGMKSRRRFYGDQVLLRVP